MHNIQALPPVQQNSRSICPPSKSTCTKTAIWATGCSSTALTIAFAPPIIPPCCFGVIGLCLTASTLGATDRIANRQPPHQEEIPVVPATLMDPLPYSVVETLAEGIPVTDIGVGIIQAVPFPTTPCYGHPFFD